MERKIVWLPSYPGDNFIRTQLPPPSHRTLSNRWIPLPNCGCYFDWGPGLWASACLGIPLLRSTLSRNRPQTSNPGVYPKPSTSTPTHNSTVAALLPHYLLSRLTWVWVPSPPAFLSPGAQQLHQQGIDYLHSQECLYHPDLKPEDWLAAYGATVVPNFTEQILGALLDPSVLAEFASEIVEPLASRHDTTHVFHYLHRTLSAQQIDWTIFVPRHRTVVDPTPPEDDLVRVLPRDEFPSSGGWTTLPRKLTT